MTPDAAPDPQAGDLARIDAFVRRHYSVDGTWRLHRHAVGLDLLRAPANVLLAPWALLLRLAALAASAAGARGVARRLAARTLVFRSDMGRAVETALLAEVVAPRTGAPPTETQRRLVADHVALRGAVAELATTLAVVAVGIVAFRALTPGVLTLAPVLTDHLALAREIAGFPLGDRLGAAWYGLFPAERPLWQTAAVGLALVVAFSLVTTFAGLLADPVQARLGIHRRRLRRLLARLDRADDRPALHAELLLARLGDVADAGATLARFLRP
jgi:hypothetical protein